MTIKSKPVQSIDELRNSADPDGGTDFFNGNVRSSKHTSYDHEERTYYVDNLIDGSS